MKTYSLNKAAQKIGVWFGTAEKILEQYGVTPIVKRELNSGQHGKYLRREYVAADVHRVVRQYRLDKAKDVADKASKAKEVKDAVKVESYKRSDGRVVPSHVRHLPKPHTEAQPTPKPPKAVVAKVEARNDAVIVELIVELSKAVARLTEAVKQNTKTISENGLAALEVATRPDGKHN